MKIIRLIVSVLFIILLLVGSLGAYIANAYGDEIKQYVIGSLNKQLTAQVEVAEVEFSVFENFPYASVQFKDLVVFSSSTDSDSLLKAKKLTCNFNLIDLYHENYTLEGLQIEEGFCRLIIDQTGQVNYSIWKSKDSSNTSFKVDLSQIDLRQLEFSYLDLQHDFETHFFIQKARSNASFSNQISQVNVVASLDQFNLRSEKLELIQNRKLELNTDFDITIPEKEIQFQTLSIRLDDLSFDLNGSINYLKNTQFNLAINSPNINLKEGLSILPAAWKTHLTEYEISGKAGLKGSIKGGFSGAQNPKVDLGFWVKDASFQKLNTSLHFTNGSFDGSFSNGDKQNLSTASLRLNHVKSDLNQGKIDGSLDLINFSDPHYVVQGNLAFSLEELTTLLELKEIQNPNGQLAGNISISGKIADLKQYSLRDFKKSGFEGLFTMDQIGFELAEDSLHFTDLSGELSLVSQQVSLGPITGKLNQNAFTLGGSLYNLIPFLNDTSEKLVGELVLDSPILNLSTLSSKKESSSAIKMPDRMHLYLECRIGMLEMNPYRLGDFEADFELKNKKLTGRDLSFKAFGGDFSGDVFFEEKEQFYAFQTLAQLSKVKIDELFLTANNFQQDFIKSNQLKGLLSSDLRLSFQLDKKGKLIVKSIKIESDVTIANGELIGLKSLEALSKYIELEELKHIRFKNLQNQLLVQDCTITIPRFNIQSSALNFSLAGSHHFNTTIDYHIVLLLSDVLRKKVKKPKASEYGYIADDGLGQTKVFLKMTGSSDKPEFAYDKTELKSHLRQEVQNEKKTIKGLLNKEFGLFKNDSTIKDTEPSTKQKTSPFQIDWEENPDKNETEQGNEPKKKAEKKGKFGKFIDKIAKPNEDEYERPKNN